MPPLPTSHLTVDKNPPLGAPPQFPIRLTTEGGIQLVYSLPCSRQPPNAPQLVGIGIKLRAPTAGQAVTGWDNARYPDWDSSWAGLFEQKLHELFWNFRLRYRDAVDQQEGDEMVLHLPTMGMPPREPTAKQMSEVRSGEVLTRWLRYGYVFRAEDIVVQRGTGSGEGKDGNGGGGGYDDDNDNDNDNGDCRVIVTGSQGDDVVILLPQCPNSTLWSSSSCSSNENTPEGSKLFARTDLSHGFEYRTHLPRNDQFHHERIAGTDSVCLENLYFVQVLPNELPSYHFFVESRPRAAAEGEERWGLSVRSGAEKEAGSRTRPDGPGSPFAREALARCSVKQKARRAGGGVGDEVGVREATPRKMSYGVESGAGGSSATISATVGGGGSAGWWMQGFSGKDDASGKEDEHGQEKGHEADDEGVKAKGVRRKAKSNRVGKQDGSRVRKRAKVKPK